MADGSRRATAKEVVTVADAGVSSSGMLFGFLPFASSGVAAPPLGSTCGTTCCSARMLASSWLGFGVEVAGLGAAVQRTVVVLVVGAAGRWGLRAERRGWGGRRGLRKEAAMTDDGMSGLLGRHKRMDVPFGDKLSPRGKRRP